MALLLPGLLLALGAAWYAWRRRLPPRDRAWLGLRRPLARFIERRFGGYRKQLEPVDERLPLRPAQDRPGPRVAVIGSGLAGLGAACNLAERGFRVVVFEREPYLGGKVGAWQEPASDGSPLEVEHGFHAFFRHYYNLHDFLERTGVKGHLKTVDDYLILARDGSAYRFGDAEPAPVLNLIDLARRGLYRVREILSTRAVHEMDVFLAYDADTVFDELDRTSFRDFAEHAELPPKLRLVFNTFARAFFASDDKLSAAELVKSFHFYYLSHDQGLIYEYPDGDYREVVLGPIQRHLETRGAEIRLERGVQQLVPLDGAGMEVDGERFDHVVVATHSAGAARLAACSPRLQTAAPRLTRQLTALRPSQRYAVWRIWIDRDVREGLPVFISTERAEVLDAVALAHRIDGSARRWAEDRPGHAVLELHCYALPDHATEEELRPAFERELQHYFPELSGFTVLHESLQLREDFTAFHVGMHAQRPETRTELPSLHLAGDWVRLPCPAMLMEAAYTSGVLAANAVLQSEGLQPYPVFSVPTRGLLHAVRKKKLARQGARAPSTARAS